MIITTQQLKEEYKNFSNPIGKIARDVKKGKLFPLVKGIYETDPNIHGSRLAGFIYGPSYLSFDYVLHHRGLIPEAVYNTFTCATYNKRKIKTYTNRYGTFIYRDIPKDAFSLDVNVCVENGYSYQIATVEKALCDKLYTLSPIRSVREMRIMLFDDLRIDENDFHELDKDALLKLAPLYRCTNLNYLKKMIRGER